MSVMLQSTTRSAASTLASTSYTAAPVRAVHAAAQRRQSMRATLVVASSSAEDGSSSGVEPPNVQKLASMAHISVTDTEAADWQPKIAGIVEWFGQLQGADLEGVPPAMRAEVDAADAADAADLKSAMRPDKPELFERGEELLQQAPEREGRYVRVPKTSTGADA